MEKQDRNDDAILLRLPKELKEELQKQAHLNGRRITAEINTRLRVSLAARGPTLQGILAREAFPNQADPSDATTRLSTAHGDDLPYNGTSEGTPGYVNRETLHATDAAMLDIWRALPTEKKLALLSLLR